MFTKITHNTHLKTFIAVGATALSMFLTAGSADTARNTVAAPTALHTAQSAATADASAASATSVSLAGANYLSDLKRPFYWATPKVTFRFTRPEEATDLGHARIPALALAETQKDAVRSGFIKWQAALASNPVPAQRTFVEVGPDEDADIEVVLMPRRFFPPSSLGQTQTSWRQGTGKLKLVHAVIWMQEGLSDNQFAYVALHEEGHAILSADHSTHTDSVLFPVVPRKPTKAILTPSDTNTICANYRNLSDATL